MSEFRRMITYLYLYEQGAKRHNVGFAKIEKRGKSCLVEIHMKNTGHSTPSIPVYFYARNNQRLPGILIGSMGLSRGNGDFKAVLEEEPFAGTIYGLEDIKGIFLPLSDEVMFVSQWDDNEFVRGQFVDLAKEAAAQKEAGRGKAQGTAAGRRNHQQEGLAGRQSPQQQGSQGRRNPSPQQQGSQGRRNPSPQQQGSQGRRNPSPQQQGSQDRRNPSPQRELPGRAPSLQAASIGRNPSPQAAPESHGANSPAADAATPAAISNTALPEHAGTNAPISLGHSRASEPSALGRPGMDEPSSFEDSGTSGSTSLEQPSSNGPSAFGHSDDKEPSAFGNPDANEPSAFGHSDANGPSAFGRSAAGSPTVSSPGSAAEPASDGSVAADLEAAEAAPKPMPSASNTTPFPSQPEQQPEALPENWEQKWKFILENYPVMTPFAGDENTVCVRLELKDIRLLPRPYWYLGNNSFLLHGFFNYRYLILGAVEKSGKKRWFLGIPGVYQNPERVMATLFGFPEFRNEKSAPINTGEFGYWFRYLNK